MSGCKDSSSNLPNAPKNTSCSAKASNNGTEGSQTITAAINFNKSISLSSSTAKDMKITVGGTAIKNINCSLTVDKKMTVCC